MAPLSLSAPANILSLVSTAAVVNPSPTNIVWRLLHASNMASMFFTFAVLNELRSSVVSSMHSYNISLMVSVSEVFRFSSPVISSRLLKPKNSLLSDFCFTPA